MNDRETGSLMAHPRLFRPGGTVAKRRRFWLVDSAGVPSRRVRLNREEMAYLNAHGCLPNRGITGIRGTINV